MTVVVVANGDVANLEWVLPLLEEATAVIAADGGAQHLADLDWQPDILIGDLDSADDGLVKLLQERGTEIIAHPSEKDETDLELALLLASKRHKEDLIVLGALGGRIDQTLANILLLAHPELTDRSIRLVERYQQGWLVETRTQIEGAVGDTVSLIPVGQDVHVASTSGLRWPLHDEKLKLGPARGLSNVMTADRAEIVISSGQLLCIHTRKGWKR